MAQVFPNGVDLVGTEIKHARAENLSSDPAASVGLSGLYWFNTVSKTLKFIADGTTVIDVLARSQQTGSQAASTISDLAAVVKAYRLDEFAAPTAARTMGGQQITGLAAGSASGHAVEFDQLNTAISNALAGLQWKRPVRLATTANDTLSGLAARDGVTPVAGDRVLAKSQTAPEANGIYVAAAGAWSRATDADSAAELEGGAAVQVDEGTTNGNTAWFLASDVVTVGTTAQSWQQFGAGAAYSAGNGIAIASNTISVALQSLGGLAFSGSNLAVDNAIVVRKAGGAIPAATSGIFTVSGSTVTINHALNNSCPDVVVRAGATPPTINGYSTSAGQRLNVDDTVVDANNLALSLPAAPASGNYTVTVMG
jgi:hypothetical protein